MVCTIQFRSVGLVQPAGHGADSTGKKSAPFNESILGFESPPAMGYKVLNEPSANEHLRHRQHNFETERSSGLYHFTGGNGFRGHPTDGGEKRRRVVGDGRSEACRS